MGIFFIIVGGFTVMCGIYNDLYFWVGAVVMILGLSLFSERLVRCAGKRAEKYRAIRNEAAQSFAARQGKRKYMYELESGEFIPFDIP